MVKLQQPMMSSQASGTLGRAIQFSRWKTRSYAGKKRNPKQPRTRPQLSARIFMSQMAKRWQGLSNAQRASWQAHPDATTTSAYHAYLKENSIRYQKLPNTRYDIDEAHCAPSATWPVLEDTLSCNFVNWTVEGRSKSVWIQFDVNVIQDNWLAIVHYCDSDTDYMRYNNISAIMLVASTGTYERLIENIPPGNHVMRILPVSHTGLAYYDGYRKPVTILP